MLNLIPRYLPRYGMAPEWAGAVRPLVLVLTGVAFLITWIFNADVNAQGGAYATGVLVLMTSAAVAVTLAARRAGQRRLTVAFALIAAGLRLHDRRQRPRAPRRRQDRRLLHRRHPRGLAALAVATRLRAPHHRDRLDARAESFLRDCARRSIRLVANEPDARDVEEYRDKIRQIVDDHDLPDASDIIFVEVTVADYSDFETPHRGPRRGHARAATGCSRSPGPRCPTPWPRCCSTSATAPASAPHIYFEWTEGNPVVHLLRFLLFGVGEVAPVTREVLRRAEPDRTRRPHVHAG